MKHVVVSFNPFTVIYTDGVLTKTVKYTVCLTRLEIEAEYSYIVFDEPAPIVYRDMYIMIYGDEVLFMNGKEIITHLPDKRDKL